MLKPEFFKITDQAARQRLQQSGVQIVDDLVDQIDELCEIRHPKLRDQPEQLAERKNAYRQEFISAGVYCYFPWRRQCVRLLAEAEYQELRTARNRNLITKSEQERFRQARVALAGLSVGSNLARLAVLQGGPRHWHLADADALRLSNLNRILAGVTDLGLPKTEVLARYLYEMDPFLQLTLFGAGVSDDTVEDFLSFAAGAADVVIDETDDLPTKILLRKTAATRRIPLLSVTDNADGVIVQVERYDEQYSFAQFAARLSSAAKGAGQSVHLQKQAVAIVKFIGLEAVATEMLACIPELGEELYSWPQLGGAATLAGVVGAYCLRRLLCHGDLPSGQYQIALPEVFKISAAGEAKRRQELLAAFFNT